MNSNERQLAFFPVEEKHREIILGWFGQKHVNEYFYGEGLENTLNSLDAFIKGEKNLFEHWIAYIGEEPFGFLMTSRIKGPYNADSPYDKWYEEGKEAITLDLLIGPETFLGKGLGHRMIREFLIDRFPHVDKVLIDPSVTNTRAIHVYEKAGFKKIEQFPQQHDSPDLCWMMHLDTNKDL